MDKIIKWVNTNVNAKGYRIYRDIKPIDCENLPAPIAEVGPDKTEYVDHSNDGRKTYFYRVSVYNDTHEILSTQEKVIVKDKEHIKIFVYNDIQSSTTTEVFNVIYEALTNLDYNLYYNFDHSGFLEDIGRRDYDIILGIRPPNNPEIFEQGVPVLTCSVTDASVPSPEGAAVGYGLVSGINTGHEAGRPNLVLPTEESAALGFPYEFIEQYMFFTEDWLGDNYFGRIAGYVPPFAANANILTHTADKYEPITIQFEKGTFLLGNSDKQTTHRIVLSSVCHSYNSLSSGSEKLLDYLIQWCLKG